VKFTYERPVGRQAKRDGEKKAREEKAVADQRRSDGLQPDGTPPGLRREGNGFAVADPAAFAQWQADQKARQEARAVIAKAQHQRDSATPE